MSARRFYTEDTHYENRLDQEIQKLNDEIKDLQAHVNEQKSKNSLIDYDLKKQTKIAFKHRGD